MATGRRERNREEKLRRVRDAAEALFHERGFEGATMREIAERADVATGTLFLYATDKRDLLFLVYGERIARTTEGAFHDLPAEAPLVEQLLFVYGRLLESYAPDPALALHFVTEQLRGGGARQKESEAVRIAFFHRLAEVVRAAQARGEVDEAVDPGQVVWSSFTLYFGALLSWLGGWSTREEALDGVLRPALELQHRGMAAPRRGP